MISKITNQKISQEASATASNTLRYVLLYEEKKPSAYMDDVSQKMLPVISHLHKRLIYYYFNSTRFWQCIVQQYSTTCS